MKTPPLPDTLWTLEPTTTFLNHGSFGACPTPVMAAQAEIRARMERQPVRFLSRELEPLLDAARTALGEFVGAQPDDLAFVPNTTTAVSTLLASLSFSPGDEILTTNHVYRAVDLAMERRLAGTGARVVKAAVPFPLESAEAVIEAVLAAVTPRTRLAVLDHITSPTALVLPIARLVKALAERGIETLVDGAHAPGQVEVDIEAINAAYYVGNCHKWLCSPKGAAFLHVRRDRQADVHPLITSHGAGSTRTDRSRFRLEFDWTGTIDFSAYLAVPAAIEFAASLGGWETWRAANHELVVTARELICEAIGAVRPCPPALLGAMAAIPLPAGRGDRPGPPLFHDPLQEVLYERHAIEVPIMMWPAWPSRWLRISAQRYNRLADYERLAEVLVQALRAEARG